MVSPHKRRRGSSSIWKITSDFLVDKLTVGLVLMWSGYNGDIDSNVLIDNCKKNN